MKERPILFSTPMVQAILEGRKTQTRRIIKDQPNGDVISHQLLIRASCDGLWWGFQDKKSKGLSYLKCPFGEIGDVLWVRETWSDRVERKYPNAQESPNKDIYNFTYKADKQPHVAKLIKWKPNIYMPKEACRIKLKIGDIRVERLQEISEEDAKSEGVEKLFQIENNFKKGDWVYKHYTNPSFDGADAKSSYKSLWESINGKKSWKQNPWVWVIDFKRIIC